MVSRRSFLRLTALAPLGAALAPLAQRIAPKAKPVQGVIAYSGNTAGRTAVERFVTISASHSGYALQAALDKRLLTTFRSQTISNRFSQAKALADIERATMQALKVPY